MSSIKKAYSSRTHPRLHSGGLILKNSSTFPLWRLVPQEYSISTHNYPTSLPPLIKLCLTSKKFKIFINTLRLLLWACTNGSKPFSFGLLFMGVGLGLTYYWIKPNFNLGANNYILILVISCLSFLICFDV